MANKETTLKTLGTINTVASQIAAAAAELSNSIQNKDFAAAWRAYITIGLSLDIIKTTDMPTVVSGVFEEMSSKPSEDEQADADMQEKLENAKRIRAEREAAKS